MLMAIKDAGIKYAAIKYAKKYLISFPPDLHSTTSTAFVINLHVDALLSSCYDSLQHKQINIRLHYIAPISFLPATILRLSTVSTQKAH